MSLSRWLVVPDVHIPYEDKKAVRAVLQHASNHRWDGAILLGDVMDCFLLSKFNEGKPGLTNGLTVHAELTGAEEWLDTFLKAVRSKNRKAQAVWIEGNHENRYARYMEANPQFKKMLDIPHALELKSKGVQWVPYWSKGDIFRLGHASFIHGFSTVQHHAAKHVRDYGSNVFYGHVHDVQEFSVRRRAKNVTIKGKSLGCLCDFNQAYMHGRPINWQHAFGIFHFWQDGSFQETTVHVHKGRFVSPLDGKVYQG